MSAKPTSTRRSFIRRAGVALSSPVAVAVASAPRLATAGKPEDAVPARLARLEDVEAIRALNQAYARHINAGATEEIGTLFADRSDAQRDPCVIAVRPFDFGESDSIDIAVDRQTASARLHSMVEFETAIGPDCPVVQMARHQGGGFVRRTERGVFENSYVRPEGTWKLRRSTFVPA
jgi:hypothetical protein